MPAVALPRREPHEGAAGKIVQKESNRTK